MNAVRLSVHICYVLVKVIGIDDTADNGWPCNEYKDVRVIDM